MERKRGNNGVEGSRGSFITAWARPRHRVHSTPSMLPCPLQGGLCSFGFTRFSCSQKLPKLPLRRIYSLQDASTLSRRPKAREKGLSTCTRSKWLQPMRLWEPMTTPLQPNLRTLPSANECGTVGTHNTPLADGPKLTAALNYYAQLRISRPACAARLANKL